MPKGTLTLQGYAPTLAITGVVSIPKGALSLQGYAPSIAGVGAGASSSLIITQGVGAPASIPSFLLFGLGESEPGIPVGTLFLQGYAPTVAFTVAIPVGTLLLQGRVLALFVPIAAIPMGSLAWRGLEPLLGITVLPPYAALRVEMALGGSYRQEVVEHEPTAWWRFAEAQGVSSVRDSSGNVHHGTVVGTLTQGEAPKVPEGGFSYYFPGNSANAVTMTALPAFGTTLSVEMWIKPDSPGAEGTVVSNSDGSVRVALTASRFVNVRYSAADHLSSSALPDLKWSHVVIIIAAGSGTFYIDGAAAGTFSTFPTGWAPTRIGRYDTTSPFKGWLDELALYPTALSSTDVVGHYDASFWTDITDDVLKGPGLQLAYGIGNNGPTDRMSDVGTLSFWLRNDSGNSGGLQGYYSPQNANARNGFTQGQLVRVVFVYHDVDYPRFLGKVTSISPEPGKWLARQTEVIAEDLMGDLVEADIRNVTLQVDKMEDELIRTLIEAIPVTSQPLALQLDEGLDVSPFAFDKLGAGQKAYAPLNSLVTSSIGFGSIGATGVFRYENRQGRQVSVSLGTFDGVNELTVPSTLDGVFNHVRASLHPKTIDAAATTVLWSQTGTVPSVLPAETIEIWGTYFNPSATTEKIGGTAQVAPAATTDYLANTLADGTGTNKTANVTVVADAFASTVKFTVTNNDAGAVFITKLQIRGKGLYDHSPVTVESFLAQPYGDRAMTLDLEYQSDITIANNLVEYLRVQFEDPSQQVTSFVFQANRDADYLLSALTINVGDRLTISEDVTGLILAAVFVHSIHLNLTEGNLLSCEFGVSSSAFFSQGVWIMDDADFSLAGSTTIFAYA